MTRKIISIENLSSKVKAAKQQGKKIVHCHGVFDLLHIGHIKHFQEAKSHGDILIVTLTPDEYVNKGPNRPAFTTNLRLEALAALESIDFVSKNEWPSSRTSRAFWRLRRMRMQSPVESSVCIWPSAER